MRSVLIVFGTSLPPELPEGLTTVISSPLLRQEAENHGCAWVNLEELVDPGSIYEASAFLEKLSIRTLPNGTPVRKSVIYKGYDLWWMYYSALFTNFALPYTQYKRLLARALDFEKIHLHGMGHRDLFLLYFQAHGRDATVLKSRGPHPFSFIPFGVLIQIVLTALSLPLLMFMRKEILVFIGDKFEEGQDFDGRMRFIYEELRTRDLRFVEFVRSLEPWNVVLAHAIRRRRPVVYSVAVAHIARALSVLTGGRSRSMRTIDDRASRTFATPDERFKHKVATYHLAHADADVWAIRIMTWVVRAIGIKGAFVPTATERNLHTVLGAKLNGIPTIGILHGVATEHYNVYDFLPRFDGERPLSVDLYGVWSEWWLSYYREHSRAYRKEQLRISGAMRPMAKSTEGSHTWGETTRVLFISEQLADPSEVMPYLEVLLRNPRVVLYMKFRPYRDGFETWLRENHPDILERIGKDRILRGSMKESIEKCDMTVGSHSTAVLEALLMLKPMAFFATRKWGDCYGIEGYHADHIFYALDPETLTRCIEKARTIDLDTLKELRERFFGEENMNGSAWVVEELISAMQDAR